MTSEDRFGDGVYWGGIALIALLGHQRRFEAFDISFHLLNILKKTIFEEVENKDYLEKKTKKQRDVKKTKGEEQNLVSTSAGDFSLKKLAKRIASIKQLTARIFDTVNTHMVKSCHLTDDTFFQPIAIIHFEPSPLPVHRIPG